MNTSKKISYVGVFFIIWGVFWSFAFILGFFGGISYFKNTLLGNDNVFDFIVFCIRLIGGPIDLVCGIGIVHFKNWARRTIMCYYSLGNVFEIVLGIMNMDYIHILTSFSIIIVVIFFFRSEGVRAEFQRRSETGEHNVGGQA